ncbi:MAG: DUF1569 domain-containing protein [Candidatus Hydrogenedentes bacterium]|nr:DUF1569 domain-containing protein [Candidatus Hydrogenedentota bacterium]
MAGLSDNTKQLFLNRFEKVAPDATPLWGKLRGAQMIDHCNSVVLYTLGETPLLPFRGTFMFQYIAAPLLLTGVMKFPKNVPLPRTKNVSPPEPRDCELAVLQATIDRLLVEVRAGSFSPPHHPYFGNIGGKKWLKFHALHFDHHLRQFGV